MLAGLPALQDSKDLFQRSSVTSMCKPSAAVSDYGGVFVYLAVERYTRGARKEPIFDRTKSNGSRGKQGTPPLHCSIGGLGKGTATLLKVAQGWACQGPVRQPGPGALAAQVAALLKHTGPAHEDAHHRSRPGQKQLAHANWQVCPAQLYPGT